MIMGVLNITPDSFSDGGRFLRNDNPDIGAVLNAARQMADAGADILDIGGESTRPGAAPVSEDQELQRVMPVLLALRDLDIIVSLDTRHAAVAQAAIGSGVHIINDISAGADPDMLGVIASSDVGYIMMHMQGTPADMQQNPEYGSVVDEVAQFLRRRFDACRAAGIGAERLMIDPGFGFGKTMAHNLALLNGLEKVRVAERPILAGLSRKSMLGKITGRDTASRQSASVAAGLLAVQRGADMLRVHDVAATADALAVLRALDAARSSSKGYMTDHER
jgi:dihydropteroate synthase